MRAIFSAWMVGSIFYGVVAAHPASKEDVIVANNLNLLREQCGYSLDKSIVSRVESSESSVEGDIFRIYFKIKIVPINRPMFAVLSFGCQSPVPDSLDDDGKARVTAREEIAEEDSGGRYFRHVAWQRNFNNQNIIGTIAYIDSLFGDGVAQKISGYFVTCPNRSDLTCFSLEFQGEANLTREEADTIPGFLQGVLSKARN
ncbi:hypothetical protein [Burkholderia ubonensis]|uniref:hypothetical protein n=1 Tax=Burkholderia ubonensis TaxID=101571 RepID=UPI0012F915D8|nr:hypothetical protein [Burkholderia ubonensis]